MSAAEIFSLSGSNLNPFLFSEVGIEVSGQRLSVVSLLARQGEDPWREAERLAAMPVEAAVECLGRAIAMMPGSNWSLPAATVIAGRLIAILPAKVTAGATFGPDRHGGWFTQPWITIAVGLALMLGFLAFRSWLAF